MRFTRTASPCARRAGSGASAPMAQARSSAPTSSCSDPFASAKCLRRIGPLSLGRPSQTLRNTDFAARVA